MGELLMLEQVGTSLEQLKRENQSMLEKLKKKNR